MYRINLFINDELVSSWRGNEEQTKMVTEAWQAKFNPAGGSFRYEDDNENNAVVEYEPLEKGKNNNE